MFMRTACRTSWKKYHCNRSGINRQSYVWICNLSSITVCHQKCQQSFSKSNHVPSKCVLVSISYDKNELFLDRIIIEEKQHLLYKNDKHQIPWLCSAETVVPLAKIGFRRRKMLLWFWWDMNHLVHCVLLNISITKEFYSEQLQLFMSALEGKQYLVLKKNVWFA